MDKRKLSIIVGLVVVIVLLFGIGFYFINQNNNNKTTTNITPTVFVNNPEKGQFGYQEPTTVVKIGTSGVSKGTYVKVQDGDIYFQSSDGSINKYPLTAEKVVLACTTQNLSNVTELDYNQVTKVKISTPTEIGSLIPANQAIVTFASDVAGTMRVDTVAIDASKCPSN